MDLKWTKNRPKMDLNYSTELDIATYPQIKTLEIKVEKQRKALSQTEEERNHYLDEATEQAKRIEELLEEVRDAESLVYTYRKEMRDLETQLKQQQNLYAAVRNDRTGLAKSLTEGHDEIADLKGKLRVLNHQFDQLKEEIETKEAALVKEAQDQARLEKEKEDLAALVEKVKLNAKEMGSSKAETEKSHLMLRDRLRQVDDELTKTKSQLEKVLRERAMLDNKLANIQAGNESLCKKLDVQEKALKRGETTYKEREEDVRVLKLEVKRLRQEETNLQKMTQNTEEMKKEVLRLQKDLLAEKTKVKSLQTELENPLNIHRWRKLEGKDPSTLELIQKIHSLQKRLIARNEDIVNKQLSLQEKEKQVNELRANLSRTPGPEVIDEARSLRTEMQKKVKIIQSLTAERNMYMTENAQVRQRMDVMAEELHESRRSALDLSKKLQKLKETRLKEQTVQIGKFDETTTISLLPSASSAPSRPKFIGGGFNLSVPPPSTATAVTFLSS